MRFSVFCPFNHVFVIFPCTLLMFEGENRWIDRRNWHVGSIWARIWRSRGIHWYLKTFLCLLIETSTDTYIFFNISVAFYSLNNIWIFSSFFSYLIMKSCFPFSTSKFCEMCPFSESQKIYGFTLGLKNKIQCFFA